MMCFDEMGNYQHDFTRIVHDAKKTQMFQSCFDKFEGKISKHLENIIKRTQLKSQV